MDSLKVIRQDDGTFLLEWDKEDPNWKWLNSLTSSEIEVIMKQAIEMDLQKKNDF